MYTLLRNTYKGHVNTDDSLNFKCMQIVFPFTSYIILLIAKRV